MPPGEEKGDTDIGRFTAVSTQSGYVERVIYEGTQEATQIAEETLMMMKKAMGLTGVWNRISRKARDAIKKEQIANSE